MRQDRRRRTDQRRAATEISSVSKLEELSLSVTACRCLYRLCDRTGSLVNTAPSEPGMRATSVTPWRELIYSVSQSFSHYPQWVTTGEGWGRDGPVYWSCLHYCRCCTNAPVTCRLRSHTSLTYEQETEILKLLRSQPGGDVLQFSDWEPWAQE